MAVCRGGRRLEASIPGTIVLPCVPAKAFLRRARRATPNAATPPNPLPAAVFTHAATNILATSVKPSLSNNLFQRFNIAPLSKNAHSSEGSIGLVARIPSAGNLRSTQHTQILSASKEIVNAKDSSPL
jgi:hypothetical protein